MIDPCNFCDKKECPRICYKKHEYLWWLLEVKEGKTMDKLKPCPFCGGQVRETRGALMAPFYFYKCSNPKCGAVMSFDNYAANTVPVKARENYNRRASDA